MKFGTLSILMYLGGHFQIPTIVFAFVYVVMTFFIMILYPLSAITAIDFFFLPFVMLLYALQQWIISKTVFMLNYPQSFHNYSLNFRIFFLMIVATGLAVAYDYIIFPYDAAVNYGSIFVLAIVYFFLFHSSVMSIKKPKKDVENVEPKMEMHHHHHHETPCMFKTYVQFWYTFIPLFLILFVCNSVKFAQYYWMFMPTGDKWPVCLEFIALCVLYFFYGCWVYFVLSNEKREHK